MTRITVEQVKDAYAKTNFKVLKNGYNDPITYAACPLSACSTVLTGDTFPSSEQVVEALGITSAYEDGFTTAFDTDRLESVVRWRHIQQQPGVRDEDLREYVRGVRDGRRVRRHVPAELNRSDMLPF
jgi:hypothetical protein